MIDAAARGLAAKLVALLANVFSDAANTLSFRNGANPQELFIHSSYTDASNYSRGHIGFVGGGQFLVGTSQAGSGPAHHLIFQTSGTDRWYVNSTSGHFLSASDLAYDLGQPTANRARGIYAGFLGTSLTTQSGTSYTVATTDSDIILSSASTVTLTLPNPASYTGREIWVRTTGGGAVNSSLTNVVPLAGGAAAASILAATAGKWAKLKSDGTNWQIMAAN